MIFKRSPVITGSLSHVTHHNIFAVFLLKFRLWTAPWKSLAANFIQIVSFESEITQMQLERWPYGSQNTPQIKRCWSGTIHFISIFYLSVIFIIDTLTSQMFSPFLLLRKTSKIHKPTQLSAKNILFTTDAPDLLCQHINTARNVRSLMACLMYYVMYKSNFL